MCEFVFPHLGIYDSMQNFVVHITAHCKLNDYMSTALVLNMFQNGLNLQELHINIWLTKTFL